jgi:hypothetical protein
MGCRHEDTHISQDSPARIAIGLPARGVPPGRQRSFKRTDVVRIGTSDNEAVRTTSADGSNVCLNYCDSISLN